MNDDKKPPNYKLVEMPSHCDICDYYWQDNCREGNCSLHDYLVLSSGVCDDYQNL